MRLMKINVYHVCLPFRVSFGHARAKHTESHNVIVSCQLEDGTVGYGESVPREYVTGESIDSVFSVFENTRRRYYQKNIVSANELIDHLANGWCGLEKIDRPTAAARCALELALLDAYGKFFYASATKFLSRFQAESTKAAPAGVSGVIGEGNLFKQKLQACAMKLYGLPAIKLKVGSDKEKVIKSVAGVRKALGKRYDLRIDANGAWSYAQAKDILHVLERFGLSAVEEPLRKEDRSRLSELKKNVSQKIFLDESVCSMDDLEWVINGKCADGINIRISKCGGLISALKMADLACKSGLELQLGSHVGECGILDAAARHFLRFFPNVRYLETSYGALLLKRSIISEKLAFGRGGKLKGSLRPTGLGIRVDEKALEGYSKRNFEALLI